MRTVYLSGQFIPESDAKLSIYDLSVMQAAAAFEMTRSFLGKHFKLREHCERLLQSCRLLSIERPVVRDALWVEWLMDICRQVTERNDHGPGEEHRLLIVVSPGCAPMYKDLYGVIPHPFVYIADFPLRYTVQGFSKYFTDGVHCVTSKVQQVPEACIPSAAKHRSRLHFHLAQQQAPAGTWPILVDDGGYWREAPGANICVVEDDTVFFCKDNALPGISMATVEELVRGMGWRAREAERYRVHSTSPRKPQNVQEVWLSGTPFGLLPVRTIDTFCVGYPGEFPGPRYKQLMNAWSAMVGVDIQQQIEAWDVSALSAATLPA